MKETEPEGAHRLYRRPAGPSSIGGTGNGGSAHRTAARLRG